MGSLDCRPAPGVPRGGGGSNLGGHLGGSQGSGMPQCRCAKNRHFVTTKSYDGGCAFTYKQKKRRIEVKYVKHYGADQKTPVLRGVRVVRNAVF